MKIYKKFGKIKCEFDVFIVNGELKLNSMVVVGKKQPDIVANYHFLDNLEELEQIVYSKIEAD